MPIMLTFGSKIVQALVPFGKQAGTTILLPRIRLAPSDDELPFHFTRTQFPFRPCDAMTINKSQGQSCPCMYLAMDNCTLHFHMLPKQKMFVFTVLTLQLSTLSTLKFLLAQTIQTRTNVTY
eukprot:g73471.t1